MKTIMLNTIIDYLKTHKVSDQYGNFVNVISITGNTVYTTTGIYHTTKLFVNGESVYSLIQKMKLK